MRLVRQVAFLLDACSLRFLPSKMEMRCTTTRPSSLETRSPAGTATQNHLHSSIFGRSPREFRCTQRRKTREESRWLFATKCNWYKYSIISRPWPFHCCSLCFRSFDVEQMYPAFRHVTDTQLLPTPLHNKERSFCAKHRRDVGRRVRSLLPQAFGYT